MDQTLRNNLALRCSLMGVAVLILFALSTGYGWAETPPVPAQRIYTVQAGDLLGVSVWKEPDLTREILVRPDGGLSFPLVGEIEASGKSIDGVRDAIAEGLARYIPDAVVTVSVKEVLGNKLYVIGEVNQPGEFIATRRVDVMQALSMAGGMTEFAARNKIIILRRDADTNEQSALKFRYKDVVSGQNLEQNIVLRGGDVVVVP